MAVLWRSDLDESFLRWEGRTRASTWGSGDGRLSKGCDLWLLVPVLLMPS